MKIKLSKRQVETIIQTLSDILRITGHENDRFWRGVKRDVAKAKTEIWPSEEDGPQEKTE